MRKKLLFLVSVFVVALFTISMAQGPEKTTEPKAATECCPQDCDIAGVLRGLRLRRRVQERPVRRLLDVRLCGKLQERMSVGRQTRLPACASLPACRSLLRQKIGPRNRLCHDESATAGRAFAFQFNRVRVFGRNHANGRFLRPSASAFRARRPSRRSCSRCRPLLRRE